MITKNNVPVTLNEVVYFKVLNASTAIIEAQDYMYAISQYAQAALRDVVGGMTFDDLLAERQIIGEEIDSSDHRRPWAQRLQHRRFGGAGGAHAACQSLCRRQEILNLWTLNRVDKMGYAC